MVILRRQVVVAVNGPGEVSAWLFPFAAALKERDPGARLFVALLPCVFASGAERGVVGGMSGVDAVCDPAETMRWIFRGQAPAEFVDGADTRVLHLGGELMLTAMLARRLRAPLAAYAEGRVSYPSLLDRICLVDDGQLPRRDASRKYRVVGNLMVDAARLRVPERAEPATSCPTVALFPGSRDYLVKHMVPFLVRVAGIVSRELPDTRWVIAKSDYVSEEQIARVAREPDGRVIDGDDAELSSRDGRRVLRTANGVEIELSTSADAMRRADVAVTIPGTNTAELAALGIPMLLLLPTYSLHILPLPGLAGHLGGVPLLGPLVKRAVAEGYLRTRRHWAHPNRRSGERVVPELVGRLSASDVATALADALRAPRGELARRLREIMGPPGGARRLVDEVLALDGGGHGR